MKIIESFPPNIEVIRQYLTPPDDTIYAWDGVIYNPSGQDLFPDQAIHEEVHMKQMKDFMNPEMWWMKYLTDKKYRLECEIEAYGKQYKWLRDKIPNKALKLALDEMANGISKHYNLSLDFHKASTLIRKYAEK